MAGTKYAFEDAVLTIGGTTYDEYVVNAVLKPSFDSAQERTIDGGSVAAVNKPVWSFELEALAIHDDETNATKDLFAYLLTNHGEETAVILQARATTGRTATFTALAVAPDSFGGKAGEVGPFKAEMPVKGQPVIDWPT